VAEMETLFCTITIVANVMFGVSFSVKLGPSKTSVMCWLPHNMVGTMPRGKVMGTL
jgi:hypothetical protein